MFPDEPERLPLLSETVRKAHRTFIPTDSRFRAAARLNQALWREQHNVPIGVSVDTAGRPKKYGHLIGAGAAAAGWNFLDPVVHRTVFRELAYREPAALIDTQRVYRNMLASTPLAYNVFGFLKANIELAEKWVAECFPEMAGTISNVQFEHSPGRGDPRFTEDGTAFDVFISLRRDDGSKVFIAIEVKYSEEMSEPEPRLRARYDDLSQSSDLYKDHEDPALRRNPHQQIWRQHLLAHAMVASGLYDGGVVALMAPALNSSVQRAAVTYSRLLNPDPGQVQFRNLPLEEAIGAIALAGAAEYARAVADRYTSFGRVHALI